MKRVIVTTAIVSFFGAFAFGMGLVSCKTTKIEDVLIKHNDVTFETLKGGELVDQYVENVSERKAWLYRKGHSPEGNCIVERYPLTRIDDKLFMQVGGKGEKCSGKNCTHCAFKKGGGCECKNSLNICEHEITRIKDLILIQR